MKDFIMVNPGYALCFFAVGAYSVAWLINAIAVEIRVCIRGYKPQEPHCHDCAVLEHEDEAEDGE